MKFIFTLAVKNLFRYYKRTIITSFSIALGIALFIAIDGMLGWADKMSIRNLKNYETATMKIGKMKFFEEEEYLPISQTIKSKERIYELLNEAKLAYTPEIKFLSNLINEVSGDGYPFVGFGIDPKSHKDVYKLEEMVFKGNFVNNGNQILISKYTADLLDVELEDYLVIEADTKYGLHNADAFKITGLFETPNPDVNRNNFFIPIDAADAFLEMEGEVNLISIRAEEKRKQLASTIESKVKSMELKDVEVKHWRELAQGYLALSQSKKGGTALILFMIFIIVTVGIANTMLMAVFERTGEIGMMRAMGTTKNEIMLNFIFESAGIGFIGGILGIIFGALLNWYLIQHGWDFSSMYGDISIGYRTSAVFRSEWNPDIMFWGLLFSIAVSAIISIIPARRALKMGISDTLKQVGKFG